MEWQVCVWGWGWVISVNTMIRYLCMEFTTAVRNYGVNAQGKNCHVKMLSEDNMSRNVNTKFTQCTGTLSRELRKISVQVIFKL